MTGGWSGNVRDPSNTARLTSPKSAMVRKYMIRMLPKIDMIINLLHLSTSRLLSTIFFIHALILVYFILKIIEFCFFQFVKFESYV